MLIRYTPIPNLLFMLKDASQGNCSDQEDAVSYVAKVVTLKWHSYNVYTISLKSVKNHLNSLFEESQAIYKYSLKSESHWGKCTPFLIKMNDLSDMQADVKYL